MSREDDLNSLDFMVSALTNTIYMSKTKPMKNKGQFEVVGTKVDVTDKVIKAVYEWFMKECKKDKHHEITFGATNGRLVYTPQELIDKEAE